MARLLPNIRAALRRAGGIQDGATRKAVDGLEQWAIELVQQLSQVDTTSVSGVVLPIAESDVTNLTTDLATLTTAVAGKVPATRAINTTAPLAGGGDLSADRTLSITANGIDNTLIRQGAALSVIGVAGNATANVADIAAGTDGDVLRRSGTTLGFGQGVSSQALFGSGLDGAVTFDGSATVLGLAPSSSTYTLTRDINTSTMTVNNGVTIITSGYRIFCTGTLTNNGIIHNNGASTTTNTGGAGGAAGIGAAGTNGGNATSGASGGSTNSILGWHTASAADLRGGIGVAGKPGDVPCRGGGGGASATTNGGNVGSIALSGAGSGGATLLALLECFPEKSTTPWVPGIGGGAGTGAGGGGGGGWVVAACKTLAGNGAFNSTGGNGANAGAASGHGGGGGGGGGIVLLIYGRNTSTCTISVAKGTGGNGDGTGKAGGVGADGLSLSIQV